MSSLWAQILYLKQWKQTQANVIKQNHTNILCAWRQVFASIWSGQNMHATLVYAKISLCFCLQCG